MRGEEDELQSLVMLRMQVIAEGEKRSHNHCSREDPLGQSGPSKCAYIHISPSLSPHACQFLVLYRTCLRMLGV